MDGSCFGQPGTAGFQAIYSSRSYKKMVEGLLWRYWGSRLIISKWRFQCCVLDCNLLGVPNLGIFYASRSDSLHAVKLVQQSVVHFQQYSSIIASWDKMSF